jgi:hypothetical protein
VYSYIVILVIELLVFLSMSSTIGLGLSIRVAHILSELINNICELLK